MGEVDYSLPTPLEIVANKGDVILDIFGNSEALVYVANNVKNHILVNES